MVDVRALFDWLVDGAPGAANPVQTLDRVCEHLLRGVAEPQRVYGLAQNAPATATP